MTSCRATPRTADSRGEGLWYPRGMQLDPRTLQALLLARRLLDDPCGPSVRDIATRTGLSVYRLIRLFPVLVGETPKQYRIDARLALAKRFLLLDDASVTEACMLVGFSSLGSFSSLFSQRVGEAPSRYRERLRPLIQVPRSWPPELVPGCFSLLSRLPASVSLRNFQEARSAAL